MLPNATRITNTPSINPVTLIHIPDLGFLANETKLKTTGIIPKKIAPRTVSESQVPSGSINIKKKAITPNIKDVIDDQ